MSRERRQTIQRRGSGRIERPVTADDFSFTEQTPLEQGFALVFRREIAPILRRHEDLRKQMRGKALAGIGIAGAAGAGGSAGAFMQNWGDATFIAPFLGLAGGFGSYKYYQSKWATGLSTEVIPVMCGFLGGMSHGGQPLSSDKFETLGVVPSHSGSKTDDTVTGSHGDLTYTLTETRLTRRSSSSKGRSRTKTVFRGLLIRIELQDPVPAIFFGRDRGGLLNRLSEAFSSPRQDRAKIETGLSDFDAQYEVYSDDPEGARRFVTRRLAAGMLEIANAEAGGARYLAAATEGRHLYLALPRSDDFLGLGSLFRPLTVAEDDFHQALADLDLPRRIIDALKDG